MLKLLGEMRFILDNDKFGMDIANIDGSCQNLTEDYNLLQTEVQHGKLAP